MNRFAKWWCLALALSLHMAARAESRISVLPRDERGWVRIGGQSAEANGLFTLSASSNLMNWQTIAVLHGDSFVFSDPATARLTQRFYRFGDGPLTATNDWKNQVLFPYELFSRGANSWVKFAIPLAEPTRVFYADSGQFVFHYDFVTARIDPFIGMEPAMFDQISQDNENRQLVLGAVLYPGTAKEYGIQFVSRDPLPRELVRDLFQLVSSTVVAWEAGAVPFYVPTFEQFAVAQSDRDYFASNGIPITSAARWARGDICYSAGWALGQLKFFSVSNVAAAYADGRLLPRDILLIDGIPAELPYVSGIISLTPATANSHVAILAQSYGIPFIYLTSDAERAQVMQWTNREVVLQASRRDGNCQTLVIPVDPGVDATVRSNLLALKSGPEFHLSAKERFGAYITSADGLVPADIKYFGGKAANYGVLRRTIPTNAPEALAISFDLWDDFMGQTLASGGTLRAEISKRLSSFVYPPNVAAVQTNLAAIRSMIRSSTQFTVNQVNVITNALRIFNRQRNIRFRSSTNVEDAEAFSGAGLYDSYSGCLADDQDGDNVGPSACDPTEEDERGVFRAIRRVFASFYNDNAFLERLRLGIDENQVGMAMLVHHSTPDDIEMANGVAIAIWDRAASTLGGDLVSQYGAVSVANPDGSAVPETVQFANRFGSAQYVITRGYSSLLRLGEHVMEWERDYRDLSQLLYYSAEAFAAIVTNKPTLQLDFEYKKVQPGVLEVKQVRQIPPTPATIVAPFVLNHPIQFVKFQGYYDDIFITHRLKSRWTLQHTNIQFAPSNLVAGFYTDLTVEYLNGTNVETVSVPVSSLSNFVHEVIDVPNAISGYIRDRWTMLSGGGIADFELYSRPDGEATSQDPVRELKDFGVGLNLFVTLHDPALSISPFGRIDYVTNHSTRLEPERLETNEDLREDLSFEVAGGNTNISVRTSYWVHGDARSGDCRCPLLRFVETTIEGFTSAPIVLHGYWSQTFEAVHVGNHQTFVFEPRLEAGISPQILSELNAANIAAIYVNRNGDAASPITHGIVMILGLDGNLRQFSDEVFSR